MPTHIGIFYTLMLMECSTQQARIDLAIAPLNDEAEWIHLNPHEETFPPRVSCLGLDGYNRICNSLITTNLLEILALSCTAMLIQKSTSN